MITFIDSGVLITASQGTEDLSNRAIKAITSVDREYASSQFIKLEILPKALYHSQSNEVEVLQFCINSIIYLLKKRNT